MKKEHLLFLLMASLVAVVGCTQSNTTTPKGDDLQATGDGQPELQSFAKNYYRFDNAHYEQSVADGKVIFLDFHADWCPICAREKPKILAAFNELSNENVVGYEVHFNDRATNEDDKEITKKLGITYQYTKVILDGNGNQVLKTLEILDKERILNELKTVAG